jgi:hypothetical protein
MGYRTNFTAIGGGAKTEFFAVLSDIVFLILLVFVWWDNFSVDFLGVFMIMAQRK